GTAVTSATDDVFVGSSAGVAVTTGSTNLFIGSSAGSNVTTGNGNILIGYNAVAPNATTNYWLNISNTIVAHMTSAAAAGGAAKVGINEATPNANVEVSGTISATHFVGDGSGLTGLSGTPDRIVSGSSSVIVNSATSTISFTMAGIVTGYLDGAGRL